MAAAIGLRSDYSAEGLRALAKASRDAKQTRRLLALASIYADGSRTAAARIGGVGLQIVRDWVVRFNAEGPAGLLDRKAPGQAPRLTAEHLAVLARAVEDGPKPYLDGVVRWRLGDLAAWLREEFGVSVSETTVSRALKRLGFRVLTARPQAHGQNPEAMEAFKNTSPRWWRRSASVMPREGASRCGSRSSPWCRHRSEAHGGRAGRPEEPDHPPLGAPRHPAPRTARPAHQVGLHIRRYPPEARQGRRPRHAVRRYRGDAGTPRRDQRRRTRVRSPKTNGLVERFNGTALDELFRVKMRETFYENVEALQADLDAWLVHYNTERPHLGYRNIGRRPVETVMSFVSQEG